MKKAENRYLNLAGAPWSPDQPNRRLALSQSFAAAAGVFLTWGALQINPDLDKDPLPYVLLATMGAGIGIMCTRARRNAEARRIGRDHMVIDMCPDSSTPPTSETVLSRVATIKEKYYQPAFGGGNFSTAAMDTVLFGANVFILSHYTDPTKLGIASLFCPFFLGFATDVFARYRQLKKVEDLKWVITDQGNAINQFKRESKQIGQTQLAPAPVQAP